MDKKLPLPMLYFIIAERDNNDWDDKSMLTDLNILDWTWDRLTLQNLLSMSAGILFYSVCNWRKCLSVLSTVVLTR